MRRDVDNPLDGADVEELMRRALEATRDTYPHPNPRVGAIVTSPEGTIKRVAAHIEPGAPHAEVLALGGLEETNGDTMIVTLEPCNHHGKTPPCVEAIVNAGIATVYVGAVDPDERVRGKGIAALRDAGVAVVETGLDAIVEANDRGYYHHRRTGLPFVTLKLAMTLDGQIAAADGTAKWISSPESRHDTHVLRANSDAVIAGAGTVRADDPSLDVRIEGWEGPQPVPVVFKGTRPLPPEAKLWRRNPIIVEPHANGVVDVNKALSDLGDAGITSVLVEGGSHLASSFVAAGAVDELIVYIGAKLAGGVGLPAFGGLFATISDALPIAFTNLERLGPDVKITAKIERTT